MSKSSIMPTLSVGAIVGGLGGLTGSPFWGALAGVVLAGIIMSLGRIADDFQPPRDPA